MSRPWRTKFTFDSPVFYLPNTNKNLNEDVVMQSVPITTVLSNSFGTFGSFDTFDTDDSNPDVESDKESSDAVDLMSTTTLSSAPPINEPKGAPASKSLTSPKVKSVKTVSFPDRSTTPRPNLTVRTSNIDPIELKARILDSSHACSLLPAPSTGSESPEQWRISDDKESISGNVTF